MFERPQGAHSALRREISDVSVECLADILRLPGRARNEVSCST
jgi:hypothetical protein